ncbi:hypothetical protein E4P42_01355 [Mycobacterium sp. PS03-16]|uniref:hypothetical protein n=1 Tax=Mycobacterium sp. PS03-16 TaxID=2559611 RepID=UPI001072F188|nr:hypothetical protein [Mycobacterium sp. PS03-16]TFV61568.1 hypothetical protein E4P42_01355 [Mycobacterium sp. PS03-16]
MAAHTGVAAQRRAIRAARLEREAAWREVYNSTAHADDIHERTRTMRDDYAASVFGQPFVEARTQAENRRSNARDRAEAAERRVEEVDAAWDAETAADPLWPDRGDLPLVLLPVRLETLYRPAESGGAELWIRVYPDDIHIDSHETALTAAERALAQRYLEVVGAPGVTDDARATAWAEVVAGVGADRGLWAVECLRSGADGGAKDATWSRAPMARMMPDHFTFSGYRSGRLMWRVDGAPVPAQLPAGFAPPGIDQDDGEVTSGRVRWQRASRWLVDFDTAVDAGMAVRVPLHDPDLHYDLVTVVGTGSADPDTAAREMGALLTAHSYTTGLSVLPAGTPTNNTPASRSGWHSRPAPRSPDDVAAARTAAAAESASQRIAHALGIDPAATSAAVEGGAGDHDDLAATAQRFMAGLLGNLSVDWMPLGSDLTGVSTDLSFLAEHFTSYVRSRGPLPVLRIGRQPYGLLPITPTDLWRGDDVHEAIVYIASSILSYFKENVHRAQRVGAGPDQDAAILDLLSRRPASTRIRYIADLKIDSFSRMFMVHPPATFGMAMADMNIPFSARGPVGMAPPGFDFAAAVQPTPELLELVNSRPLHAYAEVVHETQAFVAGLPPEGQGEWPPELIAKMQAVNASAAQLDPSTSGLFYQLGFPLFRTLWWLSLLYRFPSGMPEDHAARPAALALQQATVAALELEAIAGQRLADLERALCESLDTVTHRVDAWATSMATARLARIRDDNPTGLRAGAYGWVTDLQPLPPGRRSARDGYLVAPSLHHATTAAVLRAGCLAHSDPSAFAVNLTSTRVRTALRTLEGIERGQTLDYLLGYRFERGLHDRQLDHLIPAFRRHYPVTPRADTDVDATATAAVAARHVVDGLALSRDRALFDAGNPTVAVGADLIAVTELIDDVADTFDAVGDLLLAESVHQIVGGNPLRAGLAADMGTTGLLPADYQVISTPRSADTVSYAVGAALTDELDPASRWDGGNGLARLEPALENWCRIRLGAPDRWVFGCLRADGSATTVSLADLRAGAWEVIRTADSGAGSTFARRLLAAAGATAFIDDSGLDDLVTLAEALRSVIASSAPLAGSHFDPVADPWAAADLDEMAGRLAGWSSAVRDALSRCTGDPGGAVAELIGCGVAVPADIDLTDTAHLTQVAPRIAASVAELTLPDQVPAPPSGVARDSTNTLEWISTVTAAVTDITGGGIRVLPRLSLSSNGLSALWDAEHRPAGADGDRLADWLRDVGRVRPAVRAFGDTLAAAEMTGGARAAGFDVTQAPATVRPPWIAVSQGTARACTVLSRDDDSPVAQPATVTGFVCDSWSEALPRTGHRPGTADEVAGIAFHTARPDARAPQAVLVAVPPDRGRGWHAEDVHAAVEEAHELARVRGMDLTDLPELRGTMPPTIEGGDFTLNLPG